MILYISLNIKMTRIENPTPPRSDRCMVDGTEKKGKDGERDGASGKVQRSLNWSFRLGAKSESRVEPS